jgi:signal transduction histidine kinase
MRSSTEPASTEDAHHPISARPAAGRARRLARFRPWEVVLKQAWSEFLSPILAKRVSITLLIVLAVLILGALQVTWAFQATTHQRLRWVRDLCEPTPMAALEGYWREYHAPPAFTTGGEAEIARWLEDWPDIQAVQSRQAPYPTWIRDGDHLRPVDPAVDGPLLASFSQASRGCPGSFWVPPKDSEPRGQFTTILVGENWLLLKRWVRGSREAEAILRKCSPAQPMLRLGYYRFEEKPDPRAPYQAWGAWPNLQVDDRRIGECHWVSSGWSMFFGEEVVFYYVPTPLFNQHIEAFFLRQLLLNSYIFLVAGAVGLLAWRLSRLWMGYRQRESDRLAAFTHSLKTPLTAARLRCELIGMDPQVVGDLQEEIMALRDELDRLTSGINNGLRLFKQPHTSVASPREPIPEAWFRDLATEFEPALEAQGRALEVSLCTTQALANPETLRVALHTVLENAVQHGSGAVRLRTCRRGRGFRIQVGDEGPGLSGEHLARLGRIPRAPGPGANPPEGGIGLGLLTRIARDEGWGLELRSAEGSGLLVQIEVHLVWPPSGRSTPC